MIARTFFLLTSFCTCSHVRRYSSGVFLVWSHMFSLWEVVNDLLSCYPVPCTCLLYILHPAQIFHATLYMSSLHVCTSRSDLSRYSVHVFFTWYIPLRSFTLLCTCLLYMIDHVRANLLCCNWHVFWLFMIHTLYITLKSCRKEQCLSGWIIRASLRPHWKWWIVGVTIPKWPTDSG